MRTILILILFLIGCEKPIDDFAYIQIDAKGKLSSVIVEFDIDGVVEETMVYLPYSTKVRFDRQVTVQWEHDWVYGLISYMDRDGYAGQYQNYKRMTINKDQCGSK